MPEYIKDSGCEGEGDRRDGKLTVTAYSVGAVEGLLFLRFQLYTPSVIGAEDICKRSFSCTDATSPSHLKYSTAFGTRFASAERIILS